jgi:hypothetical protein
VKKKKVQVGEEEDGSGVRCGGKVVTVRCFLLDLMIYLV